MIRGGQLPRRALLVATLTSLTCCSSRELQHQDLGPPLPPDLRAPAPTLPPFAHEACGPLSKPSMKLRRVQLAGVWLSPRGYALEAPEAAKKWVRKRLVLGVLADPRGAHPGTLRNIDLLMAKFARAKVHAVILLGGIAHDPDEQRRIVRRILNAVNVPLLVLPGDRAGVDGLRGTLAMLGHRVVDLSLARMLRHPAATLFSLPGLPHARQLLSGAEGCAYSASDLKGLTQLGSENPQPRVLLAYTPPRGDGPHAVDRSLAAINCGSEALRELMQAGDLRIGLFAHISEAGGLATTRAGSPLAEHTWSASMLLNVGSVEAIPRRGLDGRWRHGMGVIVELRDGRARFRRVSLDRVPAVLLQKAPL